jgi:hypothetical protein
MLVVTLGVQVRATQGSVQRGIEHPLGFTEFRLFRERRVNRSDLIAAFGISISQASADLNHHFGMAPDTMSYGKSARTYVRGGRFQPWFLKPDASRHLSQLHTPSASLLAQKNTRKGQGPTFHTVPGPVRSINARRDTDWQHARDAVTRPASEPVPQTEERHPAGLRGCDPSPCASPSPGQRKVRAS